MRKSFNTSADALSRNPGIQEFKDEEIFRTVNLIEMETVIEMETEIEIYDQD